MKYFMIELNCLKNIIDKQSEFPIESSEIHLYQKLEMNLLSIQRPFKEYFYGPFEANCSNSKY